MIEVIADPQRNPISVKGLWEIEGCLRQSITIRKTSRTSGTACEARCDAGSCNLNDGISRHIGKIIDTAVQSQAASRSMRTFKFSVRACSTSLTRCGASERGYGPNKIFWVFAQSSRRARGRAGAAPCGRCAARAKVAGGTNHSSIGRAPLSTRETRGGSAGRAFHVRIDCRGKSSSLA